MKNKLIEQLIAIKSYSGSEENLKQFISRWFESRGIKSISQGENLLVHLEGGDKTKALIFNSHMDTVSAGNESMWKYGPWNPTHDEGKLIGLGASDMKSGLAASMLTCHKFSKSKPPVDLWFTYVVKEEQDGSGTKDFVDWFVSNGYAEKYSQMAAIFTEPTKLYEIEHGHRGNLFIYAKAEGDSGHASRPAMNRDNSVKKILLFADKLKTEMEKWKLEYGDDEFDPPTVGLFTSICAGICDQNGKLVVESANKFPASCKATFDVRTGPKFHAVAFEKIVKLGENCGVEVGLEFPAGPAGYTKPTDKLVLVTQKILGKSKLCVSQGSADMGFLTQIGVSGITFGPGDKAECHVVNESCDPKMIGQAVEIYMSIVNKWGEVE